MTDEEKGVQEAAAWRLHEETCHWKRTPGVIDYEGSPRACFGAGFADGLRIGYFNGYYSRQSEIDTLAHERDEARANYSAALRCPWDKTTYGEVVRRAEKAEATLTEVEAQRNHYISEFDAASYRAETLEALARELAAVVAGKDGRARPELIAKARDAGLLS